MGLVDDLDWRQRAACAGMDPSDADLIFYPAGARGLDPYVSARQVCAGCPVQAECLASALAEEARPSRMRGRAGGRWGFRGGLSPSERAGASERKREAAQRLRAKDVLRMCSVPPSVVNARPRPSSWWASTMCPSRWAMARSAGRPGRRASLLMPRWPTVLGVGAEVGAERARRWSRGWAQVAADLRRQ